MFFLIFIISDNCVLNANNNNNTNDSKAKELSGTTNDVNNDHDVLYDLCDACNKLTQLQSALLNYIRKLKTFSYDVMHEPKKITSS